MSANQRWKSAASSPRGGSSRTRAPSITGPNMGYLLYHAGEVASAPVAEERGAQSITVRPGDFLMCPKGTKSRWIVKTACKKVFFLRSPEPMGETAEPHVRRMSGTI